MSLSATVSEPLVDDQALGAAQRTFHRYTINQVDAGYAASMHSVCIQVHSLGFIPTFKP